MYQKIRVCKKKPCIRSPKIQDPKVSQQRKEFENKQQNFDLSSLMFLDETGLSTSLHQSKGLFARP